MKLMRIIKDVVMLILFFTIFGSAVAGGPGAITLFLAGILFSAFMVYGNLKSGYYDYDE